MLKWLTFWTMAYFSKNAIFHRVSCFVKNASIAKIGLLFKRFPFFIGYMWNYLFILQQIGYFNFLWKWKKWFCITIWLHCLFSPWNCPFCSLFVHFNPLQQFMTQNKEKYYTLRLQYFLTNNYFKNEEYVKSTNIIKLEGIWQNSGSFLAKKKYNMKNLQYAVWFL